MTSKIKNLIRNYKGEYKNGKKKWKRVHLLMLIVVKKYVGEWKDDKMCGQGNSI